MPAPTRPSRPTCAPAVALAPVRSLGVVLAGCPACRRVLGLAGAEGLELAVAAHRRGCPARRPAPTRPAHRRRRLGWAGEDACGGCGCEAALYAHGADRRCGDCLAALRLELPA